MPRTLGRMTERKDFLRVAGGRRKWVAPGLILQVAPSDAPEAAGPHAVLAGPVELGTDTTGDTTPSVVVGS